MKEFFVHPKTLGQGSIWSTMFSRDPKQKFLYVADGVNGKIWILNREDGKEVSSIGHKGHRRASWILSNAWAWTPKVTCYTTRRSDHPIHGSKNSFR